MTLEKIFNLFARWNHVFFTNNHSSSLERIDHIYYLALMKEIYQPVPFFRISIHTGDASKLLYLLMVY